MSWTKYSWLNNAKIYCVVGGALLVTGCNYDYLKSEAKSRSGLLKGDIIGGTVDSAQLKLGLTCSSDDLIAKLYALNDVGVRSEGPIAESKISSDGSYLFTLKQIEKKDHVSHIVETTGCGTYSARYITEFNRSQDVDAASTLISYISGSTLNLKVSDLNRTEMERLIGTLSSLKLKDIKDVYERLASDTNLKSTFQEVFKDSDFVAKITESSPRVSEWIIPAELSEGVLYKFTVQGHHWAGSKPSFEWYLDQKLLSTTSDFDLTPSANSQGTRTLTIRVGHEGADGRIDQKRGHMELAKKIEVVNSILPEPPEMALISQSPGVTHNRDISVRITTGEDMFSCRSFDALAITTEDKQPLASQFIVKCSMNSSQIVASTTLGVTDGLYHVYLWALDASNTISTTPRKIPVILDQTPPQVSLTPLSIVKGGANRLITFQSVDGSTGVVSTRISYKETSAHSYTDLATLTSGESSYLWNVPAVDSLTAMIKLTVTDGAGNVTIVESSSFAIDSTAPSAPSVTLVSPANTNSAEVLFTPTSCGNGSHLIVTSGSSPTLASAGWQACTLSQKSFTMTDLTNGPRTLALWTMDDAGWISPSSSTVSLYYDDVAPILSITALGTKKGGTSVAASFTATEINANASSVFSLEVFNGSSWVSFATTNHSVGASSSSVFSVSATLPAVSMTNARVRVSLTDLAGNTSVATSDAFTIDSTAPVVTTYEVAGGASIVALPSVTVAVQASDNLLAVTHIKITETATFEDSGWVPLESLHTFSLSTVNGEKTLYVWVKDSVGNVSARASRSLSLDFGTPPVITIISPIGGSNFSSGQNLSIEWTCSSDSGLVASPITEINYTVDDSASFVPIATNLTNNINATTGSYGWVLPSALAGVTFRLQIKCKALSGLVSNALSSFINSGDWTLYAGDPWYGKSDVAASLADVSSDNHSSVTMDSSGNLFYRKEYSVMRLDAVTGMVTRFFGNNTAYGCTMVAGSDRLTGGISTPIVLGTRSNGTSLLVYSWDCATVFAIDLTTNMVSVVKTFSGLQLSSARFLTADAHLIFAHDSRVYTLDLSIDDAPTVHIHGNGSCGTTPLQVGQQALNQEIGDVTWTPACGHFSHIIANPDRSKIWLNVYAHDQYRLDLSGSTYVVGQKNISPSGEYAACTVIAADASTRAYCTPRYTGRRIATFDFATQTWTTNQQIPFVNNDDSGFLRLGGYGQSLLSIYSLNAIHHIKPSTSTNWTYTLIAGQPLTTMGNGRSISEVGLQMPIDLVYGASTNSLWIRNSGHVRKINLNTNTATTIFHQDLWGYPMGLGISVQPNETGFAITNSCGLGKFIFSLSLSSGLFVSGEHFVNGPCGGNAADYGYPIPTGTPKNLYDVGKYLPNSYSNQRVVYHTNGQVYFAGATSTNTDAIVYRSDQTSIYRVAGVDGVGGYNGAHHGTSASVATLSFVHHLQEDANGDLLVWDGSRLRRITITTESSVPKIYDVIDYSSISGFATSNVYDALFDESSGNTYMVDGDTLSVKRIHSTNGVYSYNLSGAGITTHPRIAKTPNAIFILDRGNRRILKVSP